MLRVIREPSPSSSPLWGWAWPRWEVFSGGSWSPGLAWGWPKGRTSTRQARSPGDWLAGDRLARGERNRKRHHWFSEGSALWVDRRVWPELRPGDASEIGGIVTATRHSDQVGRNCTWRVLAELSVASEPGNERLATESVAEVVKG